MFHVHPGVLRSHSEFFVRALRKVWKEGQEGLIKLPEETPSLFSCYVKWLYADDIFVADLKDCKLMILLRLVDLYGLGERLMDPKLKDRAIDAMKAAVTECIITKVLHDAGRVLVETVYTSTPSGSPARRFFVDMYMKEGKPEWFEQPDATWNPDFMQEYTAGLLRTRVLTPQSLRMYDQSGLGVRVDPFRAGVCTYHCHGKDEACDRKDK